MPAQGINVMHDEFIQTRCFPTMQTGPWQGPSSWCYRVYCVRCGTSELFDSRDDAWPALKAHRPKKAKPAKKAAGKSIEWEDFF